MEHLKSHNDIVLRIPTLPLNQSDFWFQTGDTILVIEGLEFRVRRPSKLRLA